MPHRVLFDDGTHRNILLEDFGLTGLAVQANQHLIVHGGEAMLLDPGGHKVYSHALAATMSLLGPAELRTIFLSHQDPDIVAAVNGWLMTTDADAWVSAIWTRFVAHFGIDDLVAERLHPIPDEGMILPLGGIELMVVPAHFLHSPGNFQIYDPVSRILYSGDLGASVGIDYTTVTDFDAHAEVMAGFHRRYMTSGAAMRAWAGMIRGLDIETIAPQHGALFEGREMVDRFVEWCSEQTCGVDLIDELYRLPTSGGVS